MIIDTSKRLCESGRRAKTNPSVKGGERNLYPDGRKGGEALTSAGVGVENTPELGGAQKPKKD